MSMSTSVSTDASAQPNILAVNNIEVIYDHVILVLKGVSLVVPEGGIVRCSVPTAPERRQR
jgi:branched-chain amino acid transport system ATP-binding protein